MSLIEAFPGSKNLVGALPCCHHLMAVEAMISDKGLRFEPIISAFLKHTRPRTAICLEIKIIVFKLKIHAMGSSASSFSFLLPLTGTSFFLPQVGSLCSSPSEWGTFHISIYILWNFFTPVLYFFKYCISSFPSPFDWKVLFWDV